MWPQEGTQSHLFDLFALWVLAERLSIPRLQNAAVERIIQEEQVLGGRDEVVWIYGNTTSESKLRKALVDMCAFVLPEEDFASLPAQLMCDTAVALKHEFCTAEIGSRSKDLWGGWCDIEKYRVPEKES